MENAEGKETSGTSSSDGTVSIGVGEGKILDMRRTFCPNFLNFARKFMMQQFFSFQFFSLYHTFPAFCSLPCMFQTSEVILIL